MVVVHLSSKEAGNANSHGSSVMAINREREAPLMRDRFDERRREKQRCFSCLSQLGGPLQRSPWLLFFVASR